MIFPRSLPNIRPPLNPLNNGSRSSNATSDKLMSHGFNTLYSRFPEQSLHLIASPPYPSSPNLLPPLFPKHTVPQTASSRRHRPSTPFLAQETFLSSTMDTIRKKLAPKKETPRKIEISAPSFHPGLVFGPGKIARFTEPEDTPENQAKWRALSYDIPAYSERTDHPTRPPLKSKRAWQKSLQKKTFEVIIPPEKVTSTFHPSGFTYSTPFQFCEEGHSTRKAPTWEEQLARYPPTHTSDGFLIHPTPPPSGYVPFQIQQALDLARKQDEARGISSSRAKKSAGTSSKGKGAPSGSPSGTSMPPASAGTSASRTPSAVRPAPAGPSSSASRTPSALNTTSAIPAPPRLRDVIKQPEYEDFSTEQKKDLLPPAVGSDRHARLKQKLAEAREAKKAKEEEALKKTSEAREATEAAGKQRPNLMASESPEGRQPLVGDFVNNSASTPATPFVHRGVPARRDIASPVKPRDIAQSPAASSRQNMSAPRTTKPSNVPSSISLAKFKFGGGSSSRADVENSASTPPRLNTGKIDYRNAPLPSLPREATHERRPSRDAVYYTREDTARAGMRSLGHSARAPSQNPSLIRPLDESTESILPTQQRQEAIAGPSTHIRSASASSTKRQGGVGLPPTTPLRVHKRNASNPVEARSVFDYASATTSRAGPQPPGPPPVMRHRDLIGNNSIKRPGRLDSLPISARSKNAKEEYFTPPPRRIRTNSSGQDSSHLDGEFGVLAPRHTRNASASAATAPPKIRLATGHGHSQSLIDKGLPAHPAVFLPVKKPEAKKPEIPQPF